MGDSHKSRFQAISEHSRQKRCVQPIKGNHDIELQRNNSYLSDTQLMKEVSNNGSISETEKHDGLRSTGGSRRSPSPVVALLRAQSQNQSPRSSPGQKQHRATSGSPLPLHQGRMQSPSHSHGQSHGYGNRTPSPQCHNAAILNSVNRMTSPTVMGVSSPVPASTGEGRKGSHKTLQKGGNLGCNRSSQVGFHGNTMSSNSSLTPVSIRSPVSAFNKPATGISFHVQPQSPVQMTNRLTNTGKLTKATSHRPSSRSPIMQSQLSHSHSTRARSNSPKLIGAMTSSERGHTRKIVQNFHLCSSGGKASSASSFNKSKSMRHSQAKQTQAESTTEYRMNAVSPVVQHNNAGQRQDPTTRDLEFLLGRPNTNVSANANSIAVPSKSLGLYDENEGFNSDTELSTGEKISKVPPGQSLPGDFYECDLRWLTTSSKERSRSSQRADPNQIRSISCALTAPSVSDDASVWRPQRNASPTTEQMKKCLNVKAQEPGTQTRQLQRQDTECTCGNSRLEGFEDLGGQPRFDQSERSHEENDSGTKRVEGRRREPKKASAKSHQRCRASSWDSPGSLRRQRKARQSQPQNQHLQLQIRANNLQQQQSTYTPSRSQQNGQRSLVLKSKQNNSLNNLQQQLSQSNRRHSVESEVTFEKGLDMDAISGMSLEDIFQLERALQSYKEQLLRQRVYASPDINIPVNPSENGNHHRQDWGVSNEFGSYDADVGEGVDSVVGSTCHPPERCRSGNCFFDDADEGVVGAMDFEEYEPSYQFQPDNINSGHRAPNFKMFCSAEPQRQYGHSSSIEDDTVDTTCPPTTSMSSQQSTKERPRNLSQSPGNISFVNRVARHLELLKLKPCYSKNLIKYPLATHSEAKTNEIGDSKEPSAFDLLHSPRSAFSRAPAISHAR